MKATIRKRFDEKKGSSSGVKLEKARKTRILEESEGQKKIPSCVSTREVKDVS